MKIKCEVYDSGYVECLEETCPFLRECANHTTAGDFRSEDGFSPELFEENNIFFCRTKTAKKHKDLPASYPKNYYKLKRGMIIFQEGEFVNVDPLA